MHAQAFLTDVFAVTCAGQKNVDPPIFPQQNGETGPQAGAKLTSPALLRRAGSPAQRFARTCAGANLSNTKGPPQVSPWG